MPDVVCAVPKAVTKRDAKQMYKQVRIEMPGLSPAAHKREAARRLGIDVDEFEELRVRKDRVVHKVGAADPPSGMKASIPKQSNPNASYNAQRAAERYDLLASDLIRDRSRLGMYGQQVSRDAEEILAKFRDLYPRSFRSLLKVRVPDNTVAELGSESVNANYELYSHVLNLSPSLRNPSKMYNNLAAQKSGWHVPRGGTEEKLVEGTFAHEYGHHLHSLLLTETSAEEKIYFAIADELNLPRPKTFGAPAANWSSYSSWIDEHAVTIRIRLSRYGTSDRYEILAEIFAEYHMMGENARPLAKRVGKLMRDITEGLK